MTAYRLPDWLGGHEVDVVGTRGDGQLIVTPNPDLENDFNRTEVHIGRRHLVEVEPPPPPPEPEDGAFALVHTANTVPEVHRRHSDEWGLIGEFERTGRTWDELHKRGSVTVLIPDPADTAPELPWRRLGRTQVHHDGDMPGRICIDIPDDDYSPDEAEQLAAVLLRAAREARKP